MTKTAIRMRDLEEVKRHNARTEQLQREGNVISAVTGTLSALSRPVSAVIGLGGKLGNKGRSEAKDRTVSPKDLSDEERKQLEELSLRKEKGERLPDDLYKIFVSLSKRARK